MVQFGPLRDRPVKFLRGVISRVAPVQTGITHIVNHLLSYHLAAYIRCAVPFLPEAHLGSPRFGVFTCSAMSGG